MFTHGTHVISGPVGAIELIVDRIGRDSPQGVVVIAHPQPLLGGSAQHKVPHFLAKGIAEAGWLVVRPNFRGVGGTEGIHDGGMGETDDLLEVVRQIRSQSPGLDLNLIGFSFGAYVQAKVAQALADRGEPAHQVCLVGMPYGVVDGGRCYDTPSDFGPALVVHGEKDERVPLASVFDWGRRSSQVISVVSGADHFFSGRLHILRALILDYMARP